MGKRITCLAGLMLCLVCGPASATTFTAQVSDQDGKPVANAVGNLVAEGRNPPALSPRLESDKVIDQREETFIPLVTVVPRGGRVVFANNDTTKHQVYSFSPVKQFEITLPQGAKSPAYVFDKTGIATLGCNIHDHMIAYVYVADSPWTAMTGKDGKLSIADVPPGTYEAELWHPQMPPGAPTPNEAVTVSGNSVTYVAKVKLLSRPSLMHSHSAHY